MPRQKTSLSVDSDIWTEVTDVCRVRGIERSDLIEELLGAWLEKERKAAEVRANQIKGLTEKAEAAVNTVVLDHLRTAQILEQQRVYRTAAISIRSAVQYLLLEKPLSKVYVERINPVVALGNRAAHAGALITRQEVADSLAAVVEVLNEVYGGSEAAGKQQPAAKKAPGRKAG